MSDFLDSMRNLFRANTTKPAPEEAGDVIQIQPIPPFSVDAVRMHDEIQRQIAESFGLPTSLHMGRDLTANEIRVRQEAEAVRQQRQQEENRRWTELNSILYPLPAYARKIKGDKLEVVRIWVVNFHGQVLGRLYGESEKIGLTMYVPKQDWDECSGLIDVDWDWKAMQRGEKWCAPAGKPWQERIG